MAADLTTHAQETAQSSPWTLQTRLRMQLWNIVWFFCFRLTPRPLSAWRLIILKLFGAKISGRPFIAATCVIKMPWQLTLEDKVAIGENVEIYNMGPVTFKARSMVGPHAYFCAGSHDLRVPELPLVTGPIVVEEDVFVGAKSTILQGVTLGKGSVVAMGAVVVRDVAPWQVVGGNPAKILKTRELQNVAAWKAMGAQLEGDDSPEHNSDAEGEPLQ